MAEASPPLSDKVEPIAVVGLGCRFPGDATSPQALWEMLLRGDSAWSEFPEDRVRMSSYFHPSGSRQGSICFRGAHFLKQNVAAFDSSFFGIPADEAKAVDPQQRMLLEVTMEALDSAGIDRNAIRKSETGVWIGSFVKDYEQISLRDYDYQPQYGATGNGTAIMSNRLSYFLDVNGPSMTIDTGCSASLVCVHQACQSLLTGETDMAIAGGAGLILTPNTMMPMTALNFLSPDGRSYTFDARANGYGRGEGVGIVIMKRLSDAIRDNDSIRAVIRGTRLNQDGRTPGITLPSTEAQIRNMRGVYDRAGLDPGKTAYVECHGTGTQAGDTRELRALSQSLCYQRKIDNPIYVGSVKANMGHLEGAAGVAGLIKGILTVENGIIPKHINFELPGNPAIDFHNWKTKVPVENTLWPGVGLRRVSVNSFGFGGTNAHAILDDAGHYLAERGLHASHNTAFLGDTLDPSNRPLQERTVSATAIKAWRKDIAAHAQGHSVPPSNSTSQVYVFSAHDQLSLLRLIQNQAQYLQKGGGCDLNSANISESLAYTLACRRTKMDWRATIVAKSPEDLQKRLQAVHKSSLIRTSEDKRPNIAFVFSGQGAQWYAMSRELFGFDVYMESIAAASKYMTEKLGSEFSLLAELLKDKGTSRINQPDISQPATTAVQVALVDFLVHRCGIVPTSVIGHSSGEIAAAYASGAISRETAWELAYYRGLWAKVLQQQPTDLLRVNGRMLVAGLSENRADTYLEKVGKERATIACINSPSSVTLSGDADAIIELEQMLNGDGVFNRLLVVDVAYHSHHMLPCAPGYSKSIAHLFPRRPARVVVKHPYRKGKLLTTSDLGMEGLEPSSIPDTERTMMFSSVTGTSVEWSYLTPEYWTANLVSPVHFYNATMAMLRREDGRKPDIIIEFGPHAALQSPLQQIFESDSTIRKPPKYLSLLKRGTDAVTTVLESLGELWARGCEIDMSWIVMRNLQMQGPRLLVNLPNYPWNHEGLHWFESHLSKANRLAVHGRYDLIGRPTPDSIPFQPRWRGFLRIKENPWIEHHKVQKTIIYPAAGMIAMVLEGARQLSTKSTAGIEISKFTVKKAMLIPTTDHGLEYALNMNKQETTKSCKANGLDDSQVYVEPAISYAFSIYSKPLDGEWQQHGSGFATMYHTVIAPTECTSRETATGNNLSCNHYHETYLSAKDICDELIIPRQLYETLDVIGMNYGTLFQNITSLQKKNNTCTFVVRIPDTKAVMPGQFEYPHILHPATLDSVFQSAFSIGGDSMVPSYIERFFVSTEPSLPCGTGSELVGYAKAARSNSREATVNFAMSDANWKSSSPKPTHQPIVVIEDMKFTRLMKNKDPGVTQFIPNHQNLCSEIVWEHIADPELAISYEQATDQLSGMLQVLVPESMDTILTNFCGMICERLNCTFLTLAELKEGQRQAAFCISLLEMLPELHIVYDWSENDFHAIKAFVTRTKGLIWITRDAQINPSNPKASMFQALARTIRSETPQSNLATLDVSRETNLTDSEIVEKIIVLSLSLFLKGTQVETRDTDFAERHGKLLVPRLRTLPLLNKILEQGHMPAEPVTELIANHSKRSLALKITDSGDPNDFYWDDDEESSAALAVDSVSIKVLTSGLGALDSDIITGTAHGNALGTDVYGIIDRLGRDVQELNVGDHVLAVARGTLRQNVRCHRSLVQKVSRDIDPSVVCLATPFTVAAYTLRTMASLENSQSILIHAGTTSFGHSAIIFAQHIGAEVFATVTNESQRRILEQNLGIPTERVLDSNTSSFVEKILQQTSNSGTNVVFDPTSAHEESNQQCVANSGYILNLTCKNTFQSQVLDYTGKKYSISNINVACLIDKKPSRLEESFNFICSDIMEWLVQCSNSTSPKAFDWSELPKAFKALPGRDQNVSTYCMTSEDLQVPIMPPRPRKLKDQLHSDSTYVLAGQGGLAMHIARMLEMNGVKNIALLSRSGTVSESSQATVAFLEHRGVNVRVFKVDICNNKLLQIVVQNIQDTMPPVRGLFQCAAVLRDAVFDTMTFNFWQAAVQPKTNGSWNLFELFPHDMDFLIFLSSSVGVIGNRGQSNYAAGNAFQDALARHIDARGSMRSVSIDLGPVLGAGMLAEDPQTLDKLKATGFFSVRLQDFELVIASAITGYTEGDERVPAQIVMGVGTGGLIRQNKTADPYWTRTALFKVLNKIDMPPDAGDINDSEELEEQTMRMLLTTAGSVEEAHEIVTTGLCKVLAISMGKQAEDVDDARPPSAYGVDSLVAVSLRNWVYKECNVDVSVFEILSDMSISDFGELVVERGNFGRTN